MKSFLVMLMSSRCAHVMLGGAVDISEDKHVGQSTGMDPLPSYLPQEAGFTHLWLPPPSHSVSKQVYTVCTHHEYLLCASTADMLHSPSHM